MQKDRHSCTARLAQICLKHADGDSRAKLWELLFGEQPGRQAAPFLLAVSGPGTGTEGGSGVTWRPQYRHLSPAFMSALPE